MTGPSPDPLGPTQPDAGNGRRTGEATPPPGDDLQRTLPHSTGTPASSAPGREKEVCEIGATVLPDGDCSYPPGKVLDGRYRILGLLGAGGMGAVYRALDLRLQQEVALKFLNRTLASDPKAVALIVNEVRVARRVSHANVCRVHDIGEIDGVPFVSMEYVDGEDLTSVLRRIGRLHGEKATQTARQLCAGLHAAHEHGVLHRDLKPANVMLDGAGDVRIADFGIAGAIEGIGDEDHAAGTPAYMAPELFTGEKASVASDIYSLGLVLYEIYTGRPLFQAKSMTELLRQHRQPVVPLVETVPDIDPQVESVILDCLQREPERRPRSAFAVLARLPGGDPLAAALASGQTPSVDLVAASGGAGTLSPRAAVLTVVAILALLAGVLWSDGAAKMFARAELQKSPQTLVVTAQRILDDLGHDTAGVRMAHGFEVDEGLVQHVRDAGATHEEWHEVLTRQHPPVMDFWYRQVPGDRQLMPGNIKGRVTWNDPPIGEEGSVQVRLDPQGRLRELIAVPAGSRAAPALEAAPTTELLPVAWEGLFEAAGLDMSRFEERTPAWSPPVFADTRAAWLGTSSIPPHTKVRVEAAALGGTPVTFEIFEELPGSMNVAKRPTTWRTGARAALILAALFLAWQTLRSGRGDWRGTRRLGIALFAGVVLFTVLTGDSGAGWVGVGVLLLKGMSHGLLVATESCLYYVALEPYVRRVYPETLISLSRLMGGRVHDPLVGKHVLAGLVFGAAITLFNHTRVFLPRLFDVPEPDPMLGHPAGLEALDGTAPAIGALVEITVDIMRECLKVFMTLALVSMLVPRRKLALGAVALIWAAVWAPPWTPPHAGLTATLYGGSLLMAGLAVFGLVRFGILSLAVGFLTFALLSSFPMNLDLADFQSTPSLIGLGALAALAIHGARSATSAPQLGARRA